MAPFLIPSASIDGTTDPNRKRPDQSRSQVSGRQQGTYAQGNFFSSTVKLC